MKKYEIIENDTITIDGDIKLYRIKACRSFKTVDKTVNEGDLGGYIQCEDNLSHDGNAWIYDNALVYGFAMIYHNAQVFGNAKVFGNVVVYDNAKVFGRSQVYDSEVYGNMRVYGDTRIYGRVSKET